MTDRDALAGALAQAGIVVENVASIGNAEQYLYDFETTDKALAALATRGYVLVEAAELERLRTRLAEFRRDFPLVAEQRNEAQAELRRLATRAAEREAPK